MSGKFDHCWSELGDGRVIKLVADITTPLALTNNKRDDVTIHVMYNCLSSLCRKFCPESCHLVWVDQRSRTHFKEVRSCLV